ncbi:MAG: excinuclease ABC subunit UvrB [Spirochaetota bacterium]|jgi:excinuclease ABC subunit B|nr:excinuclease ABC subunit UvrB [Spirochaetota bacterium]
MSSFNLIAPYTPSGDQPQAIAAISASLRRGARRQTLVGVTGSGKTFAMANIIQNIKRPALVLTHNKTLAAQLYREFKGFFPENAVEYFVSYYDYYQPEAYVAANDMYIEKDSSINDEIDRMRLAATSALLARSDVIIVASVSCIYGLGSPDDYREQIIGLRVGERLDRAQFIRHLISVLYERNDDDFTRSTFRVRGDVIDVHPAYTKNTVRISFFGDEIESIEILEAMTGRLCERAEHCAIYPAKHFVTTPEKIERAIHLIEDEMTAQAAHLREIKRDLEAHRIEQRTRFDIEMLREIGHCKGIENYSRHLAGRKAGERPAVLLDYFPKDFIVFVDESHVTIPQLHGMYRGDRARKEILVEYGFRLPSALDNRPLYFEEFEELVPQIVFISATPGDYERKVSEAISELVIRPTGLVDPPVEVLPAATQIDDLMEQIRRTTAAGYRALVTTLTKKMAEELSDFLAENGVRVRWLHAEVETIERVELLRALRAGEYDVLVGINLLREGLDLPEVGLVAILDADKIGFLRSASSLIQTAGRAARNIDGRVIMYADRESDAMKKALEEMTRRREKQIAYNTEHNITPLSIRKEVETILERRAPRDDAAEKTMAKIRALETKYDLSVAEERSNCIFALEEAMHALAENLEFEEAAKIRDEVHRLKSGRKADAARVAQSATDKPYKPRLGRRRR